MRDGMLEFKDAPMFARVMADPEICKGVLERILGLPIERIEYLNAEQALDSPTDAKGVRLDVFAKGSGRAFDVEMQVAWEPALGKRMRYYQAAIDQACLDKSGVYDLLEESYVIFICDFDAYGRGLPVYRLERRCLEDATVEAGDASHWLVLNACAWERDADGPRAALLEYVHRSASADDGLIRRIEASVQKANEDRQWRERVVGFMTLEHSNRARESSFRRLGREEGLREGLQEGEQRYALLSSALLEANRIDDLKRAANDPTFRESLFAEFGI